MEGAQLARAVMNKEQWEKVGQPGKKVEAAPLLFSQPLASQENPFSHWTTVLLFFFFFLKQYPSDNRKGIRHLQMNGACEETTRNF